MESSEIDRMEFTPYLVPIVSGLVNYVDCTFLEHKCLVHNKMVSTPPSYRSV